MATLYLQTGNFFATRKFAATRIYPIEGDPESSKKIDNSVVNRLKVKWTVENTPADDSELCALKTNDFLSGEKFEARLSLERSSRYYGDLFLQVSTEAVESIVGRVVLRINNLDSICDITISKNNVVDGNKWVLEREIMCGRVINNVPEVLYMEVDISYVIFERTQGQEYAPGESKISRDFASLLLDKDGTDITLKVGSSELRHGHKLILGARSPVIKAMLSTDMKGKTGSVIDLQMPVSAAEAFLSFIYSGSIAENELASNAEQLFAAALKYDMPDLIAYTEFALYKIITVENAARLLLLGFTHDVAKLKAHAAFFLERNKAQVIATEGWKEAAAANPKIIFEAVMIIL